MRFAFAVSSAIALSACVQVSPDNAGKQSTASLCLAVLYANNEVGSAESGANALEELQKRGGFTTSELRQISKSKPIPGMSEAAGLCAWGYAQNGVNTTMTAGGTTRQYTYGDGRYSSRRYLYTTNGVVTAVQQL